jgi:hypothetical protein
MELAVKHDVSDHGCELLVDWHVGVGVGELLGENWRGRLER